MQKPRVSITMPFYKGEDYIEESVRSVADQTFTDFELIVVDDCSPIPAFEILKGFDFPWLKIIRHEKNSGLADSRNTAHKETRGDYILPLDCDDLLLPAFLEKCVNFLDKNPETGAVFTQVDIFGYHQQIWAPEASLIGIMAGNPVPSTIMYRREVYDSVDGYREGLRKSVDSDFWIRVLNKNWHVHRIEEPLFKYRKHESSISNEDRWTEVSDLATDNEYLYKENLLEVLKTFEQRYNKLKHEYRILEEGFQEMDEGYKDLLSRYDDVVARLQSRSVRHQLNRVFGSKENQ